MVNSPDEQTLTISFPEDPRHNAGDLPKRVYATVNAAAFILNQLADRYQELEKELLNYDACKRLEENSPHHGRSTVDMGYERRNIIVSKAWDIVDWSERLRKVLGCIAGVKKKAGWYSEAVKALSEIAAIRNFIQHYDREIKSFIHGSYPLMGAVIACYPIDDSSHYTRIVLSTPLRSVYHQDVNISGMPDPNGGVKSPIDKVRFSIAGKFVDLSALNRALQRVLQSMKAELTVQYDFQWPDV